MVPEPSAISRVFPRPPRPRPAAQPEVVPEAISPKSRRLAAWAKRAYIGGMGVLRRALWQTGFAKRLARAPKDSAAFWLRSLLAIYDAEDLIRLDVPWWSVEAAEEVDRFLASRQGSARVFEWGSGASTVWLARRAATVISIEHDPVWTAEMAPRLNSHVNVVLRTILPIEQPHEPVQRSGRPGFEGLDFAAYVGALAESDGLFDLIVIDGRCRSACLEEAVERLAPGGLIVFDDSQRQRYQQVFAVMIDFVRRPISGRAYCLPYRSETSLLRRIACSARQERRRVVA